MMFRTNIMSVIIIIIINTKIIIIITIIAPIIKWL